MQLLAGGYFHGIWSRIFTQFLIFAAAFNLKPNQATINLVFIELER
jgi:hypothetical protein